MAIYLFHGLLYTYLENATTFLENLNTFGETLLLLMGCVLMTVLFSLEPFTRFTNLFNNLKFAHKNGTA